MRHRNKKAILNRPADQRKALMRSLVTSLFVSGAIKTTGAKANALSSAAEKLITLAKTKLAKGEEFNAIREIQKTLFSEEACKKLMEYAKSTKKNSGFTRVTKLRHRVGDGALIAQVALITEE